jgi:hypothetical protein
MDATIRNLNEHVLPSTVSVPHTFIAPDVSSPHLLTCSGRWLPLQMQLPRHGSSGTLHGDCHGRVNLVVLLTDDHSTTPAGVNANNATLIESAPWTVHVSKAQ